MILLSEENQSSRRFPGRNIVRIGFSIAVIVTFLVFIPSLSNEFVFDDHGFIVGNTSIQKLDFETVRSAFTEFYLNYWAPITTLSWALDHAFWGLDPFGYHLINNILHSINAGLVFLFFLLLLQAVTMQEDDDNTPTSLLTNPNAMAIYALLGALFFALHPLRVESVAWASDRKALLALFFGVPCLLAYMRYAMSLRFSPGIFRTRHFLPASRPYWFAVILYCFSLLSKPLLVMMPLVLIILDWYPLGRFSGNRLPALLSEKIPFVACSGAVSVITTVANRPLFVSYVEYDMFTRVLNAARAIMQYLRLTFWSVDLSPFYLRPANITSIGLEYGIPVLFFFVVTISCALLAKRFPVLVAAWAVYLIALFPLLGFTQAGPQGMAARYTYFASMPVSFLASLVIAVMYHKASFSRFARLSIVCGTAVILVSMCLLTQQHISFWKNDVILWTRVIELQPHSIGRAYFQRGTAYFSRGEFAKALPDLDTAVSIAASKKYNRMHEIYIYRARARKQLGDLDGAIADYSSALLSDTSSDRITYYSERGEIYREQGRLGMANEDFRLASETIAQHR